MLKEGRYVFTYPSLFLNLCYRTYFFSWIICRFIRSPYLCNVFFIVLDLRLTKVGARRCSFFYVYTSHIIRIMQKEQEVYSHRLRYTSILTFHQTITLACLSKPAEVRALHRFACRHKQKLQRQVCELLVPVFH